MNKSVKGNIQLKINADARFDAGRAFRVARLETGKSQVELAQALGSTQPTINRWEHGIAGPPVTAIRALGKMISDYSRKELFKAAGIEDETDGLLQVDGEARRIGVLNSLDQLGETDPMVDAHILLPAQWFPEDTNIRAAKFAKRISPLFGDEVIALVDVRYRDADRLLNCIVVARTPAGNDAMRLSKDRDTFFLVSVGDGADPTPRIVRSEGDWSILGKVVKWIGDAPSPRK